MSESTPYTSRHYDMGSILVSNHMPEIVDSYKLGNISVTIAETDHPQKLMVTCNDGNYRSEFTVRRYEYKNYKRHMNQRIKDAYNDQYREGEN